MKNRDHTTALAKVTYSPLPKAKIDHFRNEAFEYTNSIKWNIEKVNRKKSTNSASFIPTKVNNFSFSFPN